MTPDLTRYHWIVLNSSAGKDSQAMLDYVAELADHAKLSRARLIVAHADLGRVEWPGTRELAQEQATRVVDPRQTLQSRSDPLLLSTEFTCK